MGKQGYLRGRVNCAGGLSVPSANGSYIAARLAARSRGSVDRSAEYCPEKYKTPSEPPAWQQTRNTALGEITRTAMPHNKDVIQLVASQLHATYPESVFKYEYEKSFGLKDRRNQPDIQVFSPGGELICAVEIGYTRPEKLDLYRTSGVPDVRWYSRDGRLYGNHARGGNASVRLNIEYKTSPNDVWRFVPSEVSAWPCPFLEDELTRLYEFPCDGIQAGVTTLRSRLAREFLRSPIMNAHEMYLHVPLFDDSLVDSLDGASAAMDEVIDDLNGGIFGHEWTEGRFYTNGMREFSVIYCDCCDKFEIDHGNWRFNRIPFDMRGGCLDAMSGYESFLAYHQRLRAKGYDLPTIGISDLPKHIAEFTGSELNLMQFLD